MTNAVLLAQMGTSNPSFKNRIINGAMMIDQRNAGASYTATTGGLRYGIDRFFIYTVGANVAGQQIAGTNTGTAKAFRITGATGSSTINFAQRIEASNIQDLANQSVTVSVKIYCSTVISGAQIYLLNPTATDNFTSNITAFSTNITLNAGLNTISVSGINGAEIGIAFTSGIGNGITVDIGNFQLEKGTTATPFEYRPYGMELSLCQRYYQTFGGLWNVPASSYVTVKFPMTMRGTPSFPFCVAGYGASFAPTVISATNQNDGALMTPNASSNTTVGFYSAAQAEL